MNRRAARSLVLAACVGVAMTSCNGRLVLNFTEGGGGSPAGSGPPGASATAPCVAPASWLPVTPAVTMATPAPHPDSECPFYEGAYQNFLVATQPGATGDPAILTYPTIDDAFISASPHGTANTSARAWLATVSQPGHRNVLVDRNGHAIYYGIQLNQAFADFIRNSGLQTVAGIMAVSPALSLPPGVVAVETAWQDIDPQDFPRGVVPPPTDFAGDPGDYSNYVTATVWIPHLRQDPATSEVLVDLDHPELRKMALVAVDLEFTLPGHPEMIWATVQHVNDSLVDPLPQALSDASILGMPDTQPYSSGQDGGIGALPSPNDPLNVAVGTPPDAEHTYLLYSHGALEAQSNAPDSSLVLDEATQSFTAPPGFNVFRVFGGSRSTSPAYSPGVVSLNESVAAMWASGPTDTRRNYRLAGAMWLDKPAFFGVGDGGQGMTFQNDDGTNPLVLGLAQVPPNVYPQVSEGVSCSVPGCTTRQGELDLGDAAVEQGFLEHTLGTDSPFSILGGDDRLSDPAIETFTQSGEFHDCMSCHNTSAVNADGVPATDPACITPNAGCPAAIIPFAAGINVTRVFSEFVMREQVLDGGAGD